jgi:hypothetical protein
LIYSDPTETLRLTAEIRATSRPTLARALREMAERLERGHGGGMGSDPEYHWQASLTTGEPRR